MTIPATPRRSPVYIGNGVATSYTFTFKQPEADTVVVTVADENNENSQELDYGVDFTVILNGDQNANPGGTVTYAGLPVGHRLVITSRLDSSQPTSIVNLGAFHANVLEGALDRLAILHQQQAEELARSMKVSPTDDTDPTGYLPALVVQVEQARDDAVNAKNAAEQAESDAQQAQGQSEQARDGAVIAAGDAEDARDEAQEWAAKPSTPVSGSDYSAKYYATSASGSAGTATNAKNDAESARDLAADWAMKLGSPVDSGEYSAKHHAQAASGSAGTATNAKNDAVQASGTAAQAASDASGFASAASGSAGAATNAKNDAENARDLAADWAAKMGSPVAGGEYSAKYWAADAENSAASIDPSNFVTASDPRLSDAREWVAATVGQAEAEAGTSTARRAWTAQRVKQAIAANSSTAGTYTFTAKGAVTAGRPVVLNGDGTVSEVTAYVAPSGTPSVLSPANNQNSFPSLVTATASGALVQVTGGNLGNGAAVCVAARLTGLAVTYGTPVNLPASGNNGPPSVAASDADDSFLAAVVNGSNVIELLPGTVAPAPSTAVSFGTGITTPWAGANNVLLRLTNTNRYLLLGSDTTAQSGQVVTVTGGVAALGSKAASGVATNANAAGCAFPDGVVDRFVMVYRQTSNNQGFAVAGSVDAAGNLSFGTPVRFTPSTTAITSCSVAYHEASGKLVVVYCQASGLYAVALTLTGNAVSPSAALTLFGTGTYYAHSVGYDPVTRLCPVAYQTPTNTVCDCQALDVSDVTGLPVVAVPAFNLHTGDRYDPVTGLATRVPGTGVAVWSLTSANATVRGAVMQAFVLSLTDKASTVGVANASAADQGAVLTTVLGGVNTAVSGLQPGVDYFVSGAGALTSIAGTDNPKVGKALGPDRLLVTRGA